MTSSAKRSLQRTKRFGRDIKKIPLNEVKAGERIALYNLQ